MNELAEFFKWLFEEEIEQRKQFESDVEYRNRVVDKYVKR